MKANEVKYRYVNLKPLIEQITEIENVEEVYIFGSRAYNTGSTRSDIDILLYAPEGVKGEDVEGIVDLEEALDFFVTRNKKVAMSIYNESYIEREDVISSLDAILLWSRHSGCQEQIDKYTKIEVLDHHVFEKSCLPISKEEQNFYTTYGKDALFMIMPFKESTNRIYEVIKQYGKEKGFVVIRADEKDFTGDLWTNVKLYLDCCARAVAVFDNEVVATDKNLYNPNVALEVGYMMAQKKPVCLLKDKDLLKLPSDLLSKLYYEYDASPVKLRKAVYDSLDSWFKNLK